MATGSGFRWINRTRGQAIPNNAIIAGFNSNRQDIFICQADLQPGLILPGKIENSACFVVSFGREHQVDNHRILVNN
jgi:hypothetical protein